MEQKKVLSDGAVYGTLNAVFRPKIAVLYDGGGVYGGVRK